MIAFNFKLFSKYRNQFFGIAIILVIVHHFTFKPSGSVIADGYMFLRAIGAMGVDIFLFLSGMGLYFSYEKQYKIESFYKRRFIRIVPAFFIICIPWYIYFDLILEDFAIGDFALHISTMWYWIYGGASGEWYISMMVILYTFFPFIYGCYKKNRKLTIETSMIFYSIITFLVWLKVPEFFENTCTFWARIPVFLIGIYCAPIIKNEYKVKRNVIVKLCLVINLFFLCIEAFFALKGATWAYSFWARLFYCPLAISLMVLCSVLFENLALVLTKKILAFLGTITLELYLTNQKCIDIVAMLFESVGMGKYILCYNVVGVILAVIISYIVHIIADMIIKLRRD